MKSEDMKSTGVDEETYTFNQCQEAVKRLTEFLDHELLPDEEAQVKQHLHECRGCFARFHFEETLLATIRERVEVIRAPVSLRHKILGLIGQSDHP